MVEAGVFFGIGFTGVVVRDRVARCDALLVVDFFSVGRDRGARWGVSTTVGVAGGFFAVTRVVTRWDCCSGGFSFSLARDWARVVRFRTSSVASNRTGGTRFRLASENRVTGGMTRTDGVLDLAVEFVEDAGVFFNAWAFGGGFCSP